ncbi:MAG: hypothetical protein LBK54_01820, partial [Propionibacteriaceae bacterium]|nr:hypothetical protein [Propionibacteriaceae bacterium]
AGQPPTIGDAAEPWPEACRFRLDDGALDQVVQQVRHDPASGATAVTWRDRRPLPEPDDQFETVWRRYRAGLEPGRLRHALPEPPGVVGTPFARFGGGHQAGRR